MSVSKAKFTAKGAEDITVEGYNSSSAKLMPRGAVLFSSRAPIGYITIAKNEISTNQGFKSAVPRIAGTGYLYYYLKSNIFYSDYGIRTLSKSEQMYLIKESGNPSDWLGPIWGISNYLTFRALLKYGYDDLAKEMAEKNVTLFGRDVEKCGEFHEYYDPETGEGISNQGFQSWNLLVGNMISYLNGKPYTEE